MDDITERELDYKIINLGSKGFIQSIQSNNESIFLAGGNQWENGWIYRFDPLNNELENIFEYNNQLNSLHINNRMIYTGGLSQEIIKIDSSGSLISKYYLSLENKITSITSSENAIYFSSADNGVQNGRIGRIDPNLMHLEYIFESEQGLENLLLDGSNTLHAAGFGILLNCNNDSTCNRNEIHSEHFRNLSVPDDHELITFTHHGNIYSSVNSGNSWKKIASNIGNYQHEGLINGLAINKNTFWTCGYSGLVYFTEDRGKSWIKIKNLPKYDWHSIHFFDNKIYLGGNEGIMVQLNLQ